MGMYTELWVDLRLKENLPTSIIYALKIMTSEDNQNFEKELLPNHDLFNTSRWDMVLMCGSFHDHKIFSETEFKNYDNEIELFFDWIAPYVDNNKGEKIGSSLYEDWDSEVINYFA